MKLYLRFARALEYPQDDLRERCAELIGELAAERPEAARAMRAMEEFVQATESLPTARLEEIYASTFDLNPACCLYVGYHLFGESYKRGAFMASLNAEYRDRGFDPGHELPDHIPVLLRFLSVLDDPERRRWLLEEAVVPALTRIVRAFEGTDNVYGAVVRAALLALRPPDYVAPKDVATALPVISRTDTPRGDDYDGTRL